MPSLKSHCEHKFLPPEETLKSWKKQLQDIIAIASWDYFVETDNGYYSLDSLPKHAGSNYHIITDNFFTSPQLLRSLRERGITSTGTVWLNRVENAPLKPVIEMEKLERGSADVVIDDNAKIAFVRWKDNKVVTVISSKYGLNPTAKTKRYIKEKKGRVNIE